MPKYLHFHTPLIFSELKTYFSFVLAATFCHKTIHKRYCGNQLALIFILLHMPIIQISINANLFPVKYLKNRVITIFNFEVCSPSPGPSFPLTYVVSIYHISIQYKGFAGSRGTYYNIKNGDDPIFVIFDRN